MVLPSEAFAVLESLMQMSAWVQECEFTNQVTGNFEHIWCINVEFILLPLLGKLSQVDWLPSGFFRVPSFFLKKLFLWDGVSMSLWWLIGQYAGLCSTSKKRNEVKLFWSGILLPPYFHNKYLHPQCVCVWMSWPCPVSLLSLLLFLQNHLLGGPEECQHLYEFLQGHQWSLLSDSQLFWLFHPF